jgi:hypothetical protein
MQISSEEALSALKDVDRATARRAELRSYEVGSAHLFWWGLIWIAGYGLSAVYPAAEWWKFWVPISLIGSAGSGYLTWRAKSPMRATWQRPALWLAIFLFIASTYAVMAPRQAEAYLAFPALIVAFSYSLAGVLKSPRYLLLGGALFVLTLAGYFLLKPWLALWLAAVGGGGMILGGLWFRKP